jgi:DNA-binding response OmpR family regulator
MSLEKLERDYSVKIGQLKVDVRNKLAQKPDGGTVSLTNADLEILFALSVTGETPMHSEEISWLCSNLRDPSHSDGVSYIDAGAVGVRIHELRSKLGDDPEAPQFIETYKGFGYRLVFNGNVEG